MLEQNEVKKVYIPSEMEKALSKVMENVCDGRLFATYIKRSNIKNVRKL
jgi:hypothetical protein